MWDRSVKIDFPCPKCGKTLEISIGKILDGLKLSCPKCGVPIKASEIKQKLKSIEQQINRIGH